MKKLNNKVIILILMIIFIGSSGLYIVNRVTASDVTDTDAIGTGEKDASTEVVNVTNEGNSNSSLENVFKSGNIPLVNKDETVYVNLNYDGSISKINIVNHFKAQEAGTYLDYGQYDNIINLTNDIAPVIKEDAIQWELTSPSEDFYYQGQFSQGELPWTFKMVYQLNGEVVHATDLPGASGELVLIIDVAENKAAEEYFRQNYMMQITVPLNMQNSTLLSAPGAVQMIAGHTKTLAYTVLPKTSNHFEIKVQVQDFAMNAIDIAMMKADLSSYMDVNEMTEGFGAMSEGMEELAEGTVALKDGLTELSGGIGTLSDGLNDLSKGTPQLSEGMDQFGDGLDTFADGLEGLSSGSNQMKDGLDALASNGGQLLTGYEGIETGLSSILSRKQEISALANEMAKSTDPQTVMLAQAILAQLEGLSELQTGLENLNTSLGQYTQGVSQVAGQYDALNSGINALPKGFFKLTGGYQELENGNYAVYEALKQLSKGLSEIDTASSEIPNQVQLLADGQKEMKVGIDQAVEEIKALTGEENDQNESQMISFAAPGKGKPNSVQFVLRTPAIEKEKEQVESVEMEEEAKGFWDKLIELFQ